MAERRAAASRQTASNRTAAPGQRASLYQMQQLDADAREDEEEALEKIERSRVIRRKNASKANCSVHMYLPELTVPLFDHLHTIALPAM